MLVLSAAPAHRRLRETLVGPDESAGSTSLGESLRTIRFCREAVSWRCRPTVIAGDPRLTLHSSSVERTFDYVHQSAPFPAPGLAS
jgi:hypothetical protein